MPDIPLRRALRILAACAAFCAASLVAGPAGAATLTYRVALDTDSSAATGCTLATANGPLAGIERVVDITVTTAGATASVGPVATRTCSGGALGSASTIDVGGWAVGIGAGSGNADVIEVAMPLALLPPAATIRAVVLADDGAGGSDATAPFTIALAAAPPAPAASIPVPLSPWLAVALGVGVLAGLEWLRRRHPQRVALVVVIGVMLVSGVAWAAGVLLDGNVDDWRGMPSAVGDPSGDAPVGTDIVAVFAQHDATTLFIRIDARVVAASTNLRPVVSAGAAQTITLPAGAPLAGSASDDGLPAPPAALAVAWSRASGPAAVAFDDPASPATTAHFTAPGTYVLSLTANDGALTAQSSVTITVVDGGPALEAIADRTVAPGSRVQIPLYGSAGNAAAVLTYRLDTAPAGALLQPGPFVDWSPTMADLGTHDFTARVSDGEGRSATRSFKVIVGYTNHPPSLAAQPDQTINAGAALTRTLNGSDPDVGDTLDYALVNGPAGMTIDGRALAWDTRGVAPGSYAVTVRVTDRAGASDTRTFHVIVHAGAAPSARDDDYTVEPGGTLKVPGPGVLANDSSATGSTLAAVKRSEPDKGTLDAFNADGSFTYTAPASVQAEVSLRTVALAGALVPDSTGYAWAADLNHDGAADVVTLSFGTPIAIDGKTGARLWTGWDTSPGSPGQNCLMYLFGTDFAMGDVDGSGDITSIAGTNCDATYTAGVSTRLIAIDTNPAHAVNGAAKVKWVSERLDEKLPMAPSVGATPVPAYALDSQGGGLATSAVPTLARLTPGGDVKVLTRFLIGRFQYPYDRDGDGTRETYAGCAVATGNEADVDTTCSVTFIVDAATGVKEAALTAPNPDNQYQTQSWVPFRQLPPVVADLDGDGQVEIISGADVFKYAAGTWSLAWQLPRIPGAINWFEPDAVLVADLDGDGKAEVILQTQWDVDYYGRQRGFVIYNADGTMLRWFSVPTWDLGMTVIADVDGDGVPELVFSARGITYAYHPDGSLLWASVMPDDDGTQPGDAGDVHYWPQAVGDRTRAGNGVQVYDLQLDGAKEVIANGNFRIAILDGRTGLVKWNFHHNGLYANSGMPMIVDADGDGHAEIFSAAAGGGICGLCPTINTIPFAGEHRDWAPAPLVFNQANYNPWAIDDAGAIAYDGGVHRSFRNQRQLGTVVDARTRDTATFSYAASDAGGESAPAAVRVQIVPQNRPPVITSTPPSAVAAVHVPGSCEAGLCAYSDFIYQVAAYDPDAGDTVHYELIQPAPSTGFPPISIDASTGIVRMYTGPCGSYGGPCDWNATLFVVAAVDSFGARTQQSFVVDISSQLRTVPGVVGMTEDDARTAIAAAELKTRVTKVFDTHAVGTVVAQDPMAGAPNVTRNATVTISVSQGPAPVAMPFVVGKRIVDAAALLDALGIDFDVDPVASTMVPAGEVMTQDPASGTLVAPGVDGPATLGVSTGPPLVKPIASIVVEPGETTRLVADTLAYKATAIFTDGTSADVTLRAAWSSSLPAVASIGVTGAAKGVGAGDTSIGATLSGKSGSATLHVKAHVADATDPTATITAPSDGTAITGPVDVVGTADDANFLRYEVAYALASDDRFTPLAEGTTPVVAGTLATFDPTVLANDQYTIRLTVFDRAGNTSVSEVSVQVKGQRKIGPFTLAFTDLDVPMTGVPITITRSYDSRDKAQGDFGIGWRLGLSTLRLRTSRVPGTGWLRTVSGPSVSLAPTGEHKVSLTLGDGRVEEFDMVFSPTSNIGSLDATRLVGLTPRPGTLGTLQALGNTDLLILDDGAETVLVDDATLDDFNPRAYRYTTVDGTVIDIDRVDGVKRVADANGNTLTLGAGGITHSSGKSVTFVRDAQNRIVQIVDPSGNAQSYAYDGNGDLVSRTDAAGLTSSYAYDRRHNLLEAIDPAGNRALRNDYDDSGRLVATTDAAGNTITYTHDIGTSSQIVTDRLGHPTRYQYDAAGNVVAKTDALGGTTLYTYDADGYLLTETDPLGRVSSRTYDARHDVLTSTDFDGNVRTWTYDGAGRMLTETDAEGRTTTNAYDAAGNLVKVTDADGGVTAHAYDGLGRRTSTTDPRGNVTSFTSDASGNLASITDPLGHVTTYAYDAANRLVTTTDPRGGTFTRMYDAVGRVTRIVDAAGQSTTFTYAQTGDGGKPATRTDALGRVTRYAYDALSRLVTTTQADGTMLGKSYDAENHVVAETDAAGATTQHAFDALGRETTTTFADGSTAKRSYDAAGRVASTTDELGNTTTYAYASNRQTVTDPLGHATLHVFDSARHRIAMTDALGRTTTTTYDSAGHPKRVTAADGSFRSYAYDASHNLVGETDAAGATVARTYDAAGHLASVTDGAGATTTYGYDAAGNRVTETDANGHVTTMTYDAQNRVVSRKRPSGDVETMAYDAVGNLASRVDFNGRTTTFAYDAMNRPVKRVLPGGTVVATSYDAAGRRTSAGGDAYQYDARGRLAREDKASGAAIVYVRDAAGAIRSVQSPGGTTSYAYDGLGRIASVTDAAGTVQYGYDAVGNLASIAYPNGVATTYAYDAQNRLTRLASARGGTTISAYDYTLNAAGKRTRVVESGSATTGRSVDYAFDGASRLVRETIAEPGVGTSVREYTYDGVGNRLTMKKDGVVTSYAYDVNDRTTSETTGAGVVASTWDANGNLRSRGAAGDVAQYLYDDEDRLVEVARAGGAVGYGYDADGARVLRTAAGVTTRYVVDKSIAAMACGCRSDHPGSASQVLAQTSLGATIGYSIGHALLDRRAADGTASYYLRDGGQSVRQLAGTGGAVSDRYTYDAFGVGLARSGVTDNAFQFAGEAFDDDAGLYDLRARQYQPETGRFLSTDPASGNAYEPVTLHRYLYAGADPVDNRDPSGRDFSLVSITLTQTIQTSLVVGLTTTAFTRATGIARSWSEAIVYGALASAATFGAIQAIVYAQTGGFVGAVATQQGALMQSSYLRAAAYYFNEARLANSTAGLSNALVQAEGAIVNALSRVAGSTALRCFMAQSAKGIMLTYISFHGLAFGSSATFASFVFSGPAEVDAALEAGEVVFVNVLRSFC